MVDARLLQAIQTAGMRDAALGALRGQAALVVWQEMLRARLPAFNDLEKADRVKEFPFRELAVTAGQAADQFLEELGLKPRPAPTGPTAPTAPTGPTMPTGPAGPPS